VLSKHPMLTPFQLKTVLYLTAGNVARASDTAPRSAENAGGTHDSQ
jgi:hypothetical protein